MATDPKNSPETKVSDTPKLPEIAFAKSGNARSCAVPLEWPLLVDGVKLKEITVRRLTGKEVAAFQESMTETDFSQEAMMAQFVDQPQGVLDALDQDDFQTVKLAVIDFLPKRIRDAMEAATQQFLTGGELSATSPTPSSGDEKNS